MSEVKETIKLSEKDTITLFLVMDNIEISIKYPKKSELKTRFKVMDKLKEMLYKL